MGYERTSEYQAYERACMDGRRGVEVDEPTCNFIGGCSEIGTLQCDCGGQEDRICPAHMTRCPDCDALVCLGGCSIVGTDDVRRCFGCHWEHKAEEEKREAA